LLEGKANSELSDRSWKLQLVIRLFWPLSALGLSLWIFELSDIDLAIQDKIYDLGMRAWPVTKADHALRLIFYDAPNYGAATIGVALFTALLGSFRYKCLTRYRRHLAFGLVVLMLVPSLASLGKSVTNVYCPLKLERYGGSEPYVRLFDAYPDAYIQGKPGRCFPAGHASGWFAMMALFFVLKRRSWRIAGLFLGLAMGWITGGYQMLIGAHFLSHTVATMLLAWIICTMLDSLILNGPVRRSPWKFWSLP